MTGGDLMGFFVLVKSPYRVVLPKISLLTLTEPLHEKLAVA